MNWPASTDVVAYTYRAAIWCPDCILDLCKQGEEYDPLDSVDVSLAKYAKRLGVDPNDEASFDSDDFPKVVFRDQVDIEERCETCGALIDDRLGLDFIGGGAGEGDGSGD